MFGFLGREQDGETKWRYKQALSLERYDFLRYLRAICDCTVAATVIAAVELTIRWNGINGVSGLDTSAQLMPLLCIMIVAVWLLLEIVDIFSVSRPGWWLYGPYRSRWQDDSSYTSSSAWSAESRNSWYEESHRQRRSPVENTGSGGGDTEPLPSPPEDAHLRV
ncbi:hypothetical protein DL546_007340 [Coniochaeta pulveracea]|uniref:Uncharacterized protein n=1 Tax=Coniochaeta pulveracea TaxID=177199 RepID=A0A420YNS2_9PEZI|nr:hypothetical protein DL546_007340 [Coniochaeta pulveracea]